MANIIEITDLEHPALAPYFKLTEAQLRSKRNPAEGIFIAESHKVIGHALDGGCVPLSFLMERKHIEGQASELIARCDVPVYTADRDVLANLTGYELTRGILCAMARPQLPCPADVLQNAQRVAVLCGIVDSTNVGAIFRSAAALGMDAVLVTPECCDPLCRRSVRVSMGTVFQTPWTVIESIASLQALGFKAAAMALTDRSVSIDDPSLAAEEKLAVVLGNEGHGLPQTVIDTCDYTVKIPMKHGVDSLNVAAAGAVAFWQLSIR